MTCIFARAHVDVCALQLEYMPRLVRQWRHHACTHHFCGRCLWRAVMRPDLGGGRVRGPAVSRRLQLDGMDCLGAVLGLVQRCVAHPPLYQLVASTSYALCSLCYLRFSQARIIAFPMVRPSSYSGFVYSIGFRLQRARPSVCA